MLEEKEYFISITMHITLYERAFYKYVTDMLQLVIEVDIRRYLYMSVNNITLHSKQETLTQQGVKVTGT